MGPAGGATRAGKTSHDELSISHIAAADRPPTQQGSANKRLTAAGGGQSAPSLGKLQTPQQIVSNQQQPQRFPCLKRGGAVPTAGI